MELESSLLVTEKAIVFLLFLFESYKKRETNGNIIFTALKKVLWFVLMVMLLI